MQQEITFELAKQLKFYFHHFSKTPASTIIKISKTLDVKYDYEAGGSLAEIRGLLASRLLSFDVNIPFRKLTPAEISFVDDISVLEAINV
ncbi:TnsA endonuclease C-terminal domain-containing protein [Desulfovibrio sp. JC022]|uniref:TnsA endonuclease C-terminal domain-containing protein n=1 Tax=Desulfovibrio sp. JC022 TaxID=2593642 RepID=UPI001EF16D6A|nr:TnsA endonuclease C-terminal domain-containing protein [Desulfovibrio sp. JC022]